jgi:hypothetical protein
MSQSSPYGRLRRALDSGSATIARPGQSSSPADELRDGAAQLVTDERLERLPSSAATGVVFHPGDEGVYPGGAISKGSGARP